MNNQNLTELDKKIPEDNKGIDLLRRPLETEPFAWDHITSVLP